MGERAARGGAGGDQSRRAGVSRWRGEVSALKGDGGPSHAPPLGFEIRDWLAAIPACTSPGVFAGRGAADWLGSSRSGLSAPGREDPPPVPYARGRPLRGRGLPGEGAVEGWARPSCGRAGGRHGFPHRVRPRGGRQP